MVVDARKKGIMQMFLMTVATLLLATDFEFSFFDDGAAEVEVGPASRVLDKEQVRRLRDTLNSPEITAILEQE